MKRMRVAVITVNWRGTPDTVECLKSLQAQDHDDWCVVVVDNGSGDDSVPVLCQAMQGLCAGTSDHWQQLSAQQAAAWSNGALPRYTLLDAGANLGFAGGNNLGIALALAGQVDWLWILNNDVEVAPSALTALLARAQRGKPSVVGSLLVYHDDRTHVQCVGGGRFDLLKARGVQVGQDSRWDGRTPPDEPAELSYVAGASMLVAADTVRQVGAMEERYFLYFEEPDWMERLRRAGPPAVATDSVVFHKEGASIGTASRSLRSVRSQYYLSRNLIHFYRWHHPLLLPIAWLRHARELLRFVLAREWPHARVTWQAGRDALLGRTGRTENL